MSSYGFSETQRITIFTADRGKCFWCAVPVNYPDVQVDHVFPERLHGAPAEWAEIRAKYGLGHDFAINSFENWVTCHQGCNLRKGGELLPPGPNTAFVIQQLLSRAPHLRRAHAVVEKETKRERVLALLRSAFDAGEITHVDIQGFLSRIGDVARQDDQRLDSMRFRARAFSRVIYGDADASDPHVVRIAFVYQGVEHESAIAPPRTDHGPLLDQLIRLMDMPIEAVRAYRGSELLEERILAGDSRAVSSSQH